MRNTFISSLLLFYPPLYADQFFSADCLLTIDGETYAKIYVDASQVEISKEKITVRLGREDINPEMIYTDGKGVFFIVPASQVWQCPSCEITINFTSSTHCSHCGSVQ